MAVRIEAESRGFARAFDGSTWQGKLGYLGLATFATIAGYALYHNLLRGRDTRMVDKHTWATIGFTGLFTATGASVMNGVARNSWDKSLETPEEHQIHRT